MLTYAEALENVLNNINTLNVEEKSLVKAQGQILAEDVYSDYNLPLSDTSGPDGYAVRAEDIKVATKDNPVILKIIETVRAGYLAQQPLVSGTAIRIMTGSVVPEGADCVVRFEDTDEPENKNGPNPNKPAQVKIYVSQSAGTNINKAGGNIKKGALLMPKNIMIGPPQVSALTAVGKKSVKVIRRPKVAIITTGDELIASGTPLSIGKTYDCNGNALQALVSHYGGEPWLLGSAKDEEKSLILKMQKGLIADAIITTGGVSKGDYDLIRQVIGKLGTLLFSRIKMAPGAAFAFGQLKKSPHKEGSGVPIFALSGPPQGCLVNFEALVRPALLKMRGLQNLNHPIVEAEVEERVANNRPMNLVKWTILQRTESGYRVKLDDSQTLLPQMSCANSLTIIPVGAEIKAGEKISVWPLEWA